jgi:hypothetical protein
VEISKGYCAVFAIPKVALSLNTFEVTITLLQTLQALSGPFALTLKLVRADQLELHFVTAAAFGLCKCWSHVLFLNQFY